MYEGVTVRPAVSTVKTSVVVEAWLLIHPLLCHCFC